MLSQYAQAPTGMEAYCFQAYADALEVIPTTLAENAGLNPIAIVTELRNRHALGERNAGINVRKVRIFGFLPTFGAMSMFVKQGQISNTLEEDIVQPLLVSTSAVELSTETVTLLLNIDHCLQVGSGTCWGNPPGLRVRVPPGAGTGWYIWYLQPATQSRRCTVKPSSSGARPCVQSQFSRNKLEVGPRTRTTSSRAHHVAASSLITPAGFTRPSTSRICLLTHWLMTLSQITTCPATKKYVDKPCPQFTTTGVLPRTSDPHFRTGFQFPLTTSPFHYRFLQSWPYVCIQTRPSQDHNMLALPSEQLPALC